MLNPSFHWIFTKFKQYIPLVLKYLSATIIPLFLGSFILAGSLAKYGNNDALNKTIMETAYKPSKEKFRECFRTHNRLFMAEHELSGLYLTMAEELKFLISNGNKPLPTEYVLLIKGLNQNQQTLTDEIEKLQKELPICYDSLYSQLEDLGLLLGVYEKVGTELTNRAEEFNNLHRARTEKAKKTIEGIDLHIIQRGFRGGLEKLASQPEVVLNGIEQLASQAQELSESDKLLFELEQKAYKRINSITTVEIQSRFNKGIWAFLLD